MPGRRLLHGEIEIDVVGTLPGPGSLASDNQLNGSRARITLLHVEVQYQNLAPFSRCIQLGTQLGKRLLDDREDVTTDLAVPLFRLEIQRSSKGAAGQFRLKGVIGCQ